MQLAGREVTGWSSAPGERRLGDQVLLQVPGAGVEVTGWTSAPRERRLCDQVSLHEVDRRRNHPAAAMENRTKCQ